MINNTTTDYAPFRNTSQVSRALNLRKHQINLAVTQYLLSGSACRNNNIITVELLQFLIQIFCYGKQNKEPVDGNQTSI